MEQPHWLGNIRAPRNGYAYVYVSNESNEPVFFDDLKVQHRRSALLEETHYYPFGLTMAGISSKKLGSEQDGLLKNEYGYNEKELWDEADLYWYEYGFRNYDAQIGRFVQIDPLADISAGNSGYHYALNDPIGYVDVDGLYPGVPTEAFNAAYTGAGTAAKVLPEVIVQATRHVSSAGKAAATLSIISGAIQIADVATDFTPFVGSGKDIYEGVRDGNWWLAGLGVVGVVADAFGGSIVKGTIKSILKSGAKELAEEGAEKILKKETAVIYERVMSKAELDVTLEGPGKNLLRGGREGENFFSRAGTISNDAKRAQQRLGLDGPLRDYKVKFEIIDKQVKVKGPRSAKPGKTGTSGGGLEYSTSQPTSIKVKSVSKLKNSGS